MIFKKFMNTKTTLIVFFICLASFAIQAVFVYAEDLREDFEVISPKYVKQVSYILQDPSFKITTPRIGKWP